MNFVAIDRDSSSMNSSNPLVDARHTLLEMSQYKHFQFDTLRRAKQSTSQILYHLHQPSSETLKPMCTSCKLPINGVRWHGHKVGVDAELCADCYERVVNKNAFTPYRVTYDIPIVENEP